MQIITNKPRLQRRRDEEGGRGSWEGKKLPEPRVHCTYLNSYSVNFSMAFAFYLKSSSVWAINDLENKIRVKDVRASAGFLRKANLPKKQATEREKKKKGNTQWVNWAGNANPRSLNFSILKNVVSSVSLLSDDWTMFDANQLLLWIFNDFRLKMIEVTWPWLRPKFNCLPCLLPFFTFCLFPKAKFVNLSNSRN